jgi:phage replication-related protein YjqB (UPF0714/DUF867 family)
MQGERRDKYPDFETLRRAEPGGFRIDCLRRPSAIAIIAPHGGKIEPWTSEIAAAIAGSHYNLYRFEGLKRSSNRDLHITSSCFDEPQGLALVLECDWVVAVHGCSGSERVVYLGGLDHALKNTIREEMGKAGFRTAIHEDPNLQGIHQRNICNRGRRGRGVQLEMSYGLREALVAARTPEGAQRLGAFVNAVRAAIVSR